MKRVIIAIFLLIVVLFVCGFENIFINRFCEKKQEEINDCREVFYSDRNLCEKKTETFKKEWDKKQITLIMFINHSIVDDITKESTRLPSFVKTADEGEFFAACDLIERALEQMKDDQRITIDSFY